MPVKDTQTGEVRAMRLTGMADAYAEQGRQVTMGELSFDERFGLLVDRQWTYREDRSLQTRLRDAKFKLTACLEDVSYPVGRGLKRAQADALAESRSVGYPISRSRRPVECKLERHLMSLNSHRRVARDVGESWQQMSKHPHSTPAPSLDGPVFLDFEASSLQDRSYPIEVAWNNTDGSIESYLIDPSSTSEWTDWSAKAEALHGISRARLRNEGRKPLWVCRRMNEALAGKTVYCADPDFDGMWLATLFAAGRNEVPRFALKGTDELLRHILAKTTGDVPQAIASVKQAWRRSVPPCHRAVGDVQCLLALYRIALRANVPLLVCAACRRRTAGAADFSAPVAHGLCPTCVLRLKREYQIRYDTRDVRLDDSGFATFVGKQLSQII
jgi:hypothetical protein